MELAMTLPQWMLLVFASWTIGVLIFPIGVYRWNLILRGTRGIHSFRADASEGADWYRRAMRAHANCVENLPVFGALVALASVTGTASTPLDVLACVVIAARFGQTITHVGFRETALSGSVRFGFFAAQLCSMIVMAAIIAR